LTILSFAPGFPLAVGIWATLYMYGKGLPVWCCYIFGFLLFAFVVLSCTPKVPPCFASFLAFLSVVFWVVSVLLILILGMNNDKSDAPSKMIKVRGVVMLERPWGSRRALVVAGEDDKKYLIKLSPLRTFREGDVVELSGNAKPLVFGFQEGFNEGLYWKVRGVDKVLTSPDISLVGTCGLSMVKWRRTLREKILLSLPPRTRGYLLAAWLGVRDPLLQEDHTRWGTSHILAISGFHVGLVVMLVTFLLNKSLWFKSAIIWVYVLASGAQVSAIRAAVMFQVFLLGKIVGRPSRAINSVCVASIALLLVRPFWFWDLGFRLSVMAALTLSLIGTDNKKWSKLVVLPAVWFTTGGLIARSFGEVPLAGIIINLFAIPFFSFVLPIGSILAVIPVIFNGLGFSRYFVLPVEFVLALWHNFADMIAFVLPTTVGASFFPFPIVVLLIMYSVYRRLWGRGFLSVFISMCAAVFVAFVNSFFQ